MNPADLRGRLNAIKKNTPEKTASRSAEKAGTQLSASERSLEAAGWKRLAPMVYRFDSLSSSPLPAEISDFLINRPESGENFIFYDTETTGLSGGAGNIVFLAGFGFAEGDRFRTVQLMLTDFPGEPDFLLRIADFIDPAKIYVSYNGKSFDANLLRTRFAMNGIKDVEFGYQLDLLYPSRRLWKNIIGGCSLGDIEQKILRKSRVLDVPGAMVPDLYFHFMRKGDYRSIEGVAAHHLEDIVSLAELLALFEQIGAAPLRLKKVDRAGLASLLQERRPEAAEAVLRAGFEAGSLRASRELGLLYKRRGDWAAAAAVWEELWTRRRSLNAGIELAMQLEHRSRNPGAALELVEQMLGTEKLLIRSILPDLRKRRARLIAKAAKAAEPDQPAETAQPQSE